MSSPDPKSVDLLAKFESFAESFNTYKESNIERLSRLEVGHTIRTEQIDKLLASLSEELRFGLKDGAIRTEAQAAEFVRIRESIFQKIDDIRHDYNEKIALMKAAIDMKYETEKKELEIKTAVEKEKFEASLKEILKTSIEYTNKVLTIIFSAIAVISGVIGGVYQLYNLFHPR